MENHLTRREVDGSVRTTPLSRVFLRLRGKDAVRWLLAIEVRCNRGIADPWHCSTDLLEDSVSDDGIEKYLDDGEDQFLFSQRTISRLLALDVLRPWLRGPDFELYRYTVAEEMRDVVAAVIGGGPWSSAVAALIEDERALVVGGTGGAASDATIDQTRMIAHEVRNALVPARHHLDALLATATEPGRERVEATRRGVVRVLGFVDELIATSELIEEPATTLALSSVIAEAIGGIEGGDRVTVDGSVARITLRAPRTRLARALVNVILNAVQATTPAQVIRVSARRTVDRIEIAVDDAGPGVAESDRARVFDDGFTTRPGGSGFGLAFVRNVVETRFRGTVRCEASDLGGARFVIAIPEVPTP
jgi:signal transduction histidine kinase